MTPHLRTLCLTAALAFPATAAAQDKLPAPLLSGLKTPECVAVTPDGKLYVSVSGEPGKGGDGAVLAIQGDKAVPLVGGLDAPRSMAAFGPWLFIADGQRVMRVDRNKRSADVFLAADAFPGGPVPLAAVAADSKGALYIADSGGTIYRAQLAFKFKGKGGPPKVSVVLDAKKTSALRSFQGMALDGDHTLLLLDGGDLYRLWLGNGTLTKLGSGFGTPSGATFDKHGRFFVTDAKAGRVLAAMTPEAKPAALVSGFQAPGVPCVDMAGRLLVPDRKAGTVTVLRSQVPGHEVDDSPLPLETAIAFPNLQWTDWEGVTATGLPNPLRPIVLTHAGDGSDRVFVATQHGVIHTFPNDQKAKQTKVFLDIQKKVQYDDRTNEEGFLGLAFSPEYKKNGEFYVFYTPKKQKLINYLSRFRVSKDDPDRADPNSEEVLLQVKRPFWNHDGGTICFGPDGYLYVALGDGGSANDPFNHGQNLKTPLGQILRIDVNKKGDGKPYAVPADNPFVGRSDALPETWAYGLRNVWRMAFDRKTGKLWAADVGQELFEEINLIQKGGNYGWRVREGKHPFGNQGAAPSKDFVEPIWEYHHDIGKSITGGTVYRGTRLPELDGAYLYADYVSGKIWALRYDEKKGRVTENRTIRDQKMPILSFGEDERGEVYLLTIDARGKGLYWFVRTPGAKAQGGDKHERDIFDYEAHKAAKGVKRIVFVADTEPHGPRGNHEFLAAAISLARSINAHYPNAYAAVHTKAKWPRDLKHADAVIVLLNHGGSSVNPAVKEAAGRGAGFMAIHYGVEVSKGDQGKHYLQWLGGYFETFWSVNPFWTPEFKSLPTHATTRGVKPFSVHDEWYYHMRFVEGMKGVTPILSALPPLKTIQGGGKKSSSHGGNPAVWEAVSAGKEQVMAWAFDRPDGGRGFGFTGLHRHANLGDDNVRTLLLNAVAWVSGLEVPAAGVPSPALGRDDLERLIDEGKLAIKRRGI